MLKNTVWSAMAKAFESTAGELVDKLLAALEAAEKEGGDIRGKQSAAILVVKGKGSGAWWNDRLYDLRVEDDPAPLVELKRLIRLKKAYDVAGKGAELLAENKVDEAMKSFTQAKEMYPDSAEIIFWPAVRLTAAGRIDESLPLFKKAFVMDKNWAILVPRLVQVGRLPRDKALIEKILAQAPKK